MKEASVRDLRYDFARIEQLLRQGEQIRITKRRKVIARLVPERPERPAMPDFLAQMREIYGDRILPVTGAEIVAEGRNRDFEFGMPGGASWKKQPARRSTRKAAS